MALFSIMRSLAWAVSNDPAGQYAKLLQHSLHWSRDELVEFRDRKLRRLIAHCYQQVPYYRKLMDERRLRPADIRRAEDLNKLPVLTKDAIRTHSSELIARNILEMNISWTRTGGTTGEPMRIAKNKECRAWSGMCYERGLALGGKTVDDGCVFLFGGSLGVSKAGVRSRLGSKVRGDLFIPAFELRSDNAADYFRQIRRRGARFITGYASAIYRLAVLARELNQKIEFTAAFTTAELLLPEWEDAIRRTFNCRVLPYYGCGEINSLGFSAESSNYLIPEEHAFLEVLQRDGSTQAYGDGRFVVTDIDNFAMPMIRYVNGDAGRLAACNSQYPFSRIEKLDGRYNSFLMSDTGDLISGVLGTHVFRLTSSVQSYRIIQEEPLRVLINVVPKSTHIGEDDRRLIANLFGRYLGPRVVISIEEVTHIAPPCSGKAIFVENRCLN